MPSQCIPPGKVIDIRPQFVTNATALKKLPLIRRRRRRA
jgi:hypothetical protein